jgi:hypothetical protein
LPKYIPDILLYVAKLRWNILQLMLHYIVYICEQLI